MDTQQPSSLTKLQNLIAASSLSPEDKELLTDTLPLTDNDYQLMLIKICDEDPAGLGLIVEKLKKKIDAINNPGKIQQLLDEERSELTRALLSETQ